MMKKIKSAHCFTLLEMLLAMALLSIIMFTLLSMMTQTQKAVSTGVSKMNASEDARLVLNMMEADLNCMDFVKAKQLNQDQSGTKQRGNCRILEVACAKDKGGKPMDEDLGKDGSREVVMRICTRRKDIVPKNEYYRITYLWGEPEVPADIGDSVKDSKSSNYDPAYLSDKCLIMRVEKWNEDYEPKNNNVYDDNGWVLHGDERVLLTNVADVSTCGYLCDDQDEMEGYYSQVVISLALVDDQTKQMGHHGPDDVEIGFNKNIESKIKKTLGDDAYEARLLRYTRSVFIDLSAAATTGSASN